MEEKTRKENANNKTKKKRENKKNRQSGERSVDEVKESESG